MTDGAENTAEPWEAEDAARALIRREGGLSISSKSLRHHPISRSGRQSSN